MRDMMSPIGLPITVVLERMDEELHRRTVILWNGRTWSCNEFIYYTKMIGPLPRKLTKMQAFSVFDTSVIIMEVEPDHGFEKEHDS